MSLRSLSLSFLLLHFHPIFGPRTLAASAAGGKLNLYDDFNCNKPSTLNPTVTLPLSTCLVTTGGEGLVIAETPPCPQGTAALIYYQDAACGVQTTYVSTGLVAQNCNQMANGPTDFIARAVMFSCQPAANNPQPSSTSTAVVSALAAVATGSNDGSGSGSSTPTAAGSIPTDTTTSNNGTGGSGGASNGGTSTSTNTSSSTSSGSSSGLGTGDIIALAVGLGIGVPTIAIMLGAWLFPDFRHKLRQWSSDWLDHIGVQRHQPRQWQYADTQEMYPRHQRFPPSSY